MQNLVQRVVQRLVVGMMVDAPITTAVLAWGGGSVMNCFIDVDQGNVDTLRSYGA